MFSIFKIKLMNTLSLSLCVMLQFNAVEIKKKDKNTYRENPELRNEMHCVVFVIKATTNLNNPRDEALKKIKEVQRRISGSRNVSVVFFKQKERKKEKRKKERKKELQL